MGDFCYCNVSIAATVGFSELPLQCIVEDLTCKLLSGDYTELKSPSELKTLDMQGGHLLPQRNLWLLQLAALVAVM